ncbi:MAG: hypothetical protein HOW97_41025 [Catenulispora sp.]|nr:hypothetical protein [Catenulispora sp.]
MSAHATSPGTIGRLYYLSNNSGGSNSYAEQDSQGNWVTHSSPLPDNATSFSPDGSLVVANSNNLAGQLVTMRPDGTGETPATWSTPGSSTPVDGGSAQWIDQSHLVFVGTYNKPGNGTDSSGRIYISDLAGKTSNALFTNDPSCGEHTISVNPVNEDIAFDCQDNGRQTWVSHHDAVTGKWADPVLLMTGALFPDYSPDGRHIAFQNSVGMPATADADGTHAAQLANAPAGYYVNAKWSPDGSLIAADERTPSNNAVIQIMDLTGNVKATLGDAQHTAYGPMWQPHPWTPPTPPPPTPGAAGPKVYRDAGADRVGTGIAISQQRWTTGGSAKAVVLATSLNYPDALSGGPLAAKKGGPLLLTDGSSSRLDPRVLTEIQRVLPHGGAVHVLGGDSAMNPGIVDQLKSLGYAITQYKGSDRADTALKVARDGMGSPHHVVLATGAGFADALAAGPYAAGPFADGPGAPAAIVLSDGAHLDPATAAFLDGKTVATVGAQAGHAWPGATKSFSGQNRFDTAARVAHEFTGPYANTQVGIANGIASATNPGYPDALTGGAFMAESNGPIVLVDGIDGVIPAESQSVLSGRTGNVRADIFGGPSIINPALAASVVALLHGTAQF